MTNKSGKNGRKPLTTRQRSLVKELCKGQSAKDAAIAAGYAPTYARQQACQAINRIKKKWPELLDEAGITDDALIDKNILPALEATETKVFHHNGKVTYAKPQVAHDVRLRATDMVLKLKGAYPTKEQQQADVGIKVILMDKITRPNQEKFLELERKYSAQNNGHKNNGKEPEK